MMRSTWVVGAAAARGRGAAPLRRGSGRRLWLAFACAVGIGGAAGPGCAPETLAPGACDNRDTDGDGIADSLEGAHEKPPRDSDHDGTPDYQDSDSDNDTIPDSVEARNDGSICVPPVNSDGDLLPDYIDLDSDEPMNDGLPDKEEAGATPSYPVDTNGNGIPDYADPDNDGDGVADRIELIPTGSIDPVNRLALAPDTDSDGTPDVLDTDSDNDGIPDGIDGSVDTDADGVANFRDTDSDGDCVADAIEAGPTLGKPADSDGDDVPDFEDRDSDNDGLTDKDEDVNCNGIYDEMSCETDRLSIDSDSDGVGDLVEVAACSVKSPDLQKSTMCSCDGSNYQQSPLTRGDFVFLSEYQKEPVPKVETLDLSTDVSNADVIFTLDTTGSMQRCLTTLADDLANLVVPQAQAKVRNVAFGVFDFRDMTDQWVIRYDHRIETVFTMPGVMAIQAALGALKAAGGGDGPEGGWLALYAIAGGKQLKVAMYDSQIVLKDVPPMMALKGEKLGDQNGAGFRKGTVPIVVTVTDAEWHDAPGSQVMGDPESGLNVYAGQYQGVPSRRDAITRLKVIGAHIVGLAALHQQRVGDPKARAIAAAVETGAVVKPIDFGSGNRRPMGCEADKCCTGQDGVGEAPLNGACPLAFSVNGDTGDGVSSSIVAGIAALSDSLRFDIHVAASDVDPDTTKNFIDRLVPNLTGVGPAAACIALPPSSLQDNFSGPTAGPGADGVLDTFPGIGGGRRICFDVIPRQNTTVPPTEMPMLFRAQITVQGVNSGQTVTLGYPRDVFFLVPPQIKNGPVG